MEIPSRLTIFFREPVIISFRTGKQLSKPNGMASYLGLMTLSNNSHDEFHELADLHTAELFDQCNALVTQQLKGDFKMRTENITLLTSK